MIFQQEIDKFIKEKRLYFVGDSLPSDWYAGFKLWLKLAEDGDPKAQFNVGRCYSVGNGIDQDLEQSDIWLQRAAAQKEPRSHFNLYFLYSDHNFSRRDVQKAEKYLVEAVQLNEPRAIALLAKRKADAEVEIANRKASTETAEAKRQVDEQAVEATRKAEAQAKEALEYAKQRLVNSESSKAAVQKCLDEGDFKGAKLQAEKAESEGYTWAKRVLASLDLSFTFRVTKDTKINTHAGCMFQGTTQYYTTKTITTTLVGNVVNKSSQDIALKLMDDKNKRPFSRWKIKADSSEDYFDSWMNEESYTFTKIYISLSDLNSSEKYSGINGISIPNATYDDICKIDSFYIPLQKSFNTVSGCFVLTASFGNENDPVVVDFRRFRDQHLLQTVLGRAVVKIYYQYGLALADSIKEKPRTKVVLRKLFSVVRIFLPR